jgi:hypothetical protein
MRLGKQENRRIRDWPMDQINKVKWSFFKDSDVEDLIHQIYHLTGTLPHLYQNIERSVPASLHALKTKITTKSHRKC